MKKPILITFMVILSSCTFTKQQKAEHLVKVYLDSALNDPHSYEKVSFDSLKAEYKSYDRSDPEGKRLDTLAASFIDTSGKYKKMADSELYQVSNTNFNKFKQYNKLDTLYSKKSDSVEAIIKIKSVGYKGPLQDYVISHTYRAKNGFGALSLHTSTFEIDSALSKVIYANEKTN